MPSKSEYHLEERLEGNLFAARLGKWIESVGGIHFDHGRNTDIHWLLKSGERRVIKTRTSRTNDSGRVLIRTSIAVDACNRPAFALVVHYLDTQASYHQLNITRSILPEEGRRLTSYDRDIGESTILIGYGHTKEGGWTMKSVTGHMRHREAREEFAKAGMPGGACLPSELPVINYEQTVVAMKHQIESFLADPATLAQGEIPVPLVAAG